MPKLDMHEHAQYNMLYMYYTSISYHKSYAMSAIAAIANSIGIFIRCLLCCYVAIDLMMYNV